MGWRMGRELNDHLIILISGVIFVVIMFFGSIILQTVLYPMWLTAQQHRGVSGIMLIFDFLMFSYILGWVMWLVNKITNFSKVEIA
jgi:hypothetical protein